MSISCDPNALLESAAQLRAIPAAERDTVIIYLLTVISGNHGTASELVAEARCLKCIPPDIADGIIISLLCEILNTLDGN